LISSSEINAYVNVTQGWGATMLILVLVRWMINVYEVSLLLLLLLLLLLIIIIFYMMISRSRSNMLLNSLSETKVCEVVVLIGLGLSWDFREGWEVEDRMRRVACAFFYSAQIMEYHCYHFRVLRI
jgi:hypothetical protein